MNSTEKQVTALWGPGDRKGGCARTQRARHELGPQVSHRDTEGAGSSTSCGTVMEMAAPYHVATLCKVLRKAGG